MRRHTPTRYGHSGPCICTRLPSWATCQASQLASWRRCIVRRLRLGAQRRCRNRPASSAVSQINGHWRDLRGSLRSLQPHGNVFAVSAVSAVPRRLGFTRHREHGRPPFRGRISMTFFSQPARSKVASSSSVASRNHLKRDAANKIIRCTRGTSYSCPQRFSRLIREITEFNPHIAPRRTREKFATNLLIFFR